jgi:hypothetical protein
VHKHHYSISAHPQMKNGYTIFEDRAFRNVKMKISTMNTAVFRFLKDF